MSHRLPLVLTLAVIVTVGSTLTARASPAHACALDQTPSLSVDGIRARVNPVTPTTQAQLAHWTYFIFPHTYRAGHPLTLTEDRREVARTLMPSALRQPWGWQFGDGQVAVGWTVRHTYARAGQYRLRVYCWNPEAHAWDAFDQATITLR